MAENNSDLSEALQQFLQEVRRTKKVWGLSAGEDWAYCPSNEYEDTDVLVFWSSEQRAQEHAEGDWADHRPVAIELQEFVHQWLPGMDEDAVLVGPNWGLDLAGVEIEPEELADELED